MRAVSTAIRCEEISSIRGDWDLIGIESDFFTDLMLFDSRAERKNFHRRDLVGFTALWDDLPGSEWRGGAFV